MDGRERMSPGATAPGYHLKSMYSDHMVYTLFHGQRAGQHSRRNNNQWRICFVWKKGDALQVEIVHVKRSVTADTALRLARFFGTSEGFWMGLQTDYDLEEDHNRQCPAQAWLLQLNA